MTILLGALFGALAIMLGVTTATIIRSGWVTIRRKWWEDEEQIVCTLIASTVLLIVTFLLLLGFVEVCLVDTATSIAELGFWKAHWVGLAEITEYSFVQAPAIMIFFNLVGIAVGAIFIRVGRIMIEDFIY
jgi:hypothetical protein